MSSDRPILGQVLDQLCPGDTLVVWKLDRLADRCATWRLWIEANTCPARVVRC